MKSMKLKSFLLIFISTAATYIVWKWQHAAPEFDAGGINVTQPRTVVREHDVKHANDADKSTLEDASPRLPDKLPSPAKAADDINELVNLKTPDSYFKAFQIIQHCIYTKSSRQTIDLLPNPADHIDMKTKFEETYAAINQYCASLTQRNVIDRVSYVEKAAEAGVPGASLAFYEAGPNGNIGDLEQRPDDPLVIEWKRKAFELITRDAMRGDINAIAKLGTAYSGEFGELERDLGKALGYELALKEIRIRRNESKGSDDWIINQIKEDASPRDLRIAEETKDLIMESCCKQK